MDRNADPMAKTRILIVQNDDAAARSLEDCLEELGYAVSSTAGSERDAIEMACGSLPDLVLIDLGGEGDVDGVELAQRIRSRFEIPVVYLTDDVEGSRFQRSQAANPFGYVLKPFDKRQLHLNIQTALCLHEKNGKRNGTIADLRHRLRLMEDVFNCIGDGVTVIDRNGDYLMLNSSAKKTFRQYSPPGLEPENVELSQRPKEYGLYHLDKETHLAADEMPFSRVLRGEEAKDIEMFVRTEATPASGLYFSVTCRPLQLGSDLGMGGVTIFREITCLKEMEAELRRAVIELRDQTRLMEAVYEQMTDGVFVADVNGRLLFSNSSAERIFGVGHTGSNIEDLCKGIQMFSLDNDAAVPAVEFPLARAIRGEVVSDVELFIGKKKNMDGVFVRISAWPLQTDDGGQIYGGVSVVHDVTRRRETELETRRLVSDLKKQTQLMEAVLENMNEGVVVADSEGHVLLSNRRTKQIVGKEVADSTPSDWSSEYGVFFPDKKTSVPSGRLPLARAFQGEVVDEMELFLRNEGHPEGAYVNASACPLWTDDARQVGVVVFRDVTKPKLAEVRLERTVNDLRRQTQLMETVFDSISDGVVVADAQGRFTLFNPGAERIVGVGGLEIPPDQWSDSYGLFFSDQKTQIPTDELPLVRAMRGDDVDSMEVFVRNPQRPEGVYLSCSGRPLTRDVEGHGGGVVVFQNITERKTAEMQLEQTMRKLQEQNELMETTFNSISDGIVVADADGKFLYVNPAAEAIAGIGATDTDPNDWAETYGTFYPDRETQVRSEDLPLMRAIFDGVSTDEEDLFIRNSERPNGVSIRVSGRPLLNQIGGVRGGVIVFRDVTAQMMAEEALVRAFAQGRLEVVETVLHNIGNAINSVTTGIETVYRRLVDDPLVRRLTAAADGIEAHRRDLAGYVRDDPQGRRVLPFVQALSEDFSLQRKALITTVERVRNRAMHIADIVRNQKSVGSPSMSRKYINLSSAISNAVKVLKGSMAKRAIVTDIDCKAAPVEIRTLESQFHQMLVNLIKNSIEAIDSRINVGRFRERPRIRIRAYAEGEFLHIDVTDNGIGIGEANPKIIFAAGYTTKDSGSGLGLHSAANFIIGSGGQIHPISEGIGQGTTMRIMLRLSSVCPADMRA